MSEHMEERRKMKEGIKTAWAEGDLATLMRTAIENFMNILRGNGSPPMSFQTFLDQTGSFFDLYVSDTSRQEHLDYVGGKLTLQLDYDGSKAVDAIPIRLSADLYFQAADKQWIVKQKQGQVDSAWFIDWDTDERAVILQQAGKLEWSVEQPCSEGSV